MVRSIERSIDVLNLLVPPGRAMTLSQLSRELGAPKSTVLTIVRTLAGRGFLAYDAEPRTYRLGPALTRFGARAQAVDLRGLAKPHLEALAAETKETAFLAVVDGGEVFYTCKIDSPQPVQYLAQVGVRRPLHCTASGKIGLAYMPDADVRAYIARTRLRRYTANTITKPARLRAELAEIRRRGYAVNRGEFFPELFGIGAPVRDPAGVVIASANLGGPLFRLNRQTGAFARAVVASANAVSAEVRRVGGHVHISD